MSDTKPTLNDVATYFDDVATIHKSTGHCDAVDSAVDYAATVRAADELLGRTLSQVRCDMWKFTDADCGKCEPCELIADIHAIRGGGGQ